MTMFKKKLPEKYSTTTMDLAGYLLCKGVELLGAELTISGTVAFIFKDGIETREKITQFFASDFKAYYDALKALKGLMYETKKQYRT